MTSCIINIYDFKFNINKKKINEITNCTENNSINLLKELYKRLIVPIYIPILMLIPYFLILSSKERKDYSKVKIITFLTGIITIIFSESIIRFLSLELSNNLFIFMAPIIFFISLYLLFFFKLNFKN